MKTGILATKNVTSEDLESTKSIMGMSAKGMEMAQYFLRDKIYNDKILAVVREYICNAYDEHVKYNIQEDVVVQIVKEDNQFIWKVRDYALGLNENDIRSIFAMYFESTKSGTNNAIGGFGVGGKAAFSYTDTFYVTSYHNGTKTNYVCTLGAGKQGIPVGEIYKLSEEPTTEQGIEVSLDVTKDYYSFDGRTTIFVKTFIPDSKIKYIHYNDVEYRPYTPDHVEVCGDFTVNLYSDFSGDSPYPNHYFIRMGGVVYPFTHHNRVYRIPSKKIVVDVPIGTLSIPISREGIENTAPNLKVFEEIEAVLDGLQKEEIAKLTPPKFGSLVAGFEKFGNDYEGRWFKYTYGTTFPKTKKWYYYVARHSLKLQNDRPIHPIYIIPTIKNTNNWHKRLEMCLKSLVNTPYEGYLSIDRSNYEALMSDLDSSIDVSDCLFIDVKSLKLPKLPKGPKQETKYLVYCGWNKKSYTSTELDEFITSKYYNDVEPDDDWYDQAKTMEELCHRTIGLVKDYGTRCNYRTANSIKMVDELKELGWITPDSDEFQSNRKRIQKIEEERRERDRAKNQLQNLFYNIAFSNRVLSAVSKNPSKVDKFTAIKNTFINEDSTRGRILKGLDRAYYSNLTRDDLRKIIKLK